MTLPSAIGPLGGKSQVGATKYSGFAFAMMLEDYHGSWGFVVYMLRDVAVLCRSACS